MSGAVAVLDVGKTNVKLALFDPGGVVLWERSNSQPPAAGPSLSACERRGDLELFRRFTRRGGQDTSGRDDRPDHPRRRRCSGRRSRPRDARDRLRRDPRRGDRAGLREDSPAVRAQLFPEPRLWAECGTPIGMAAGDRPRRLRPRALFAVLSAILGLANDRGRRHGGDFDRLPYRPLDARRRPRLDLVAALGLQGRVPPLLSAWTPFGPPSAEFAAAAGLGRDVRVLCGVHDFNASIIPYLAHWPAPFTVVSTGTWVILLGVGLPIDGLDPKADMLANLDITARPTATGRFMGGREYAGIAGPTSRRPREKPCRG